MELFITFTLKLIDQCFTTSKSVFIAKEKYLTGALLNAISTFFYFIVVVRVAQSNSIFSILSICFATFIGTYLSGTIIKKSEGDRLYIYRITSDTFDNGTKFADTIRKNNIAAIHTNTCYNNDHEKTLFCEVYCKTREESRNVLDVMPKEFKYHVQSPLN